MHPELEDQLVARGVAGTLAGLGFGVGLVADEPGLRAVHIAVDGWSEMLVECEHQLGRERPDGGRHEIHPVDRSDRALYHRPEMTHYDRLSSLDASFLHLERPEYPMHVGAVSVLEGAPFFDADGRFRISEVRDLVLSRLPLMPRFRRRLMSVPYEQGRPIWVDDDRFDITYHVRHTACPGRDRGSSSSR